MANSHERYEQLAVGHVLGGLEPVADAEFRSHLVGCESCRSKVAELRGIAADLAAAERDERARERVQTELPRRVREDGDDPPRGSRIGIRHVTVAAVAVVLLTGAVAFWNLHLRTSAATYSAVAVQRGDVLRELAVGVPVEAELADGVDGVVVLDGEQIAFSLTGITPLLSDESLIAWLIGPDGAANPVFIVRPGQFDDGALAAVVDEEGADEFVLSRERGQPGERPGPQRVLRVALRASG